MSIGAMSVQKLGHDFFTVYFYRPCKLRLCTVLIFLPSYTTLLHVDWRGQAPTPLMQPFQPLLSVFLGFLKFFVESFFSQEIIITIFLKKNVQGDVDPRFHCGICEMWTSKKTFFSFFCILHCWCSCNRPLTFVTGICKKTTKNASSIFVPGEERYTQICVSLFYPFWLPASQAAWQLTLHAQCLHHRYGGILILFFAAVSSCINSLSHLLTTLPI